MKNGRMPEKLRKGEQRNDGQSFSGRSVAGDAYTLYKREQGGLQSAGGTDRMV